MSLLLANIIALFHGTFVVFLIITVILSLFDVLKKYRFIEFLLFIGIVLTILSFLIFGNCFLTTIEKNLRTNAGTESYSSGFISNYLGKIGINISDNSVFIFLTTIITIGIISEIYWNKKEIQKLLKSYFY